jgi:hypothetical protein
MWLVYHYIVSLVVVTTLAEESVVNDTVNVELIEEGITVLYPLALMLSLVFGFAHLRDGSSEDNNFV